MRVLLATGIEELDRILAAGLTKAGVEIASECYIREYVVEMAKQKETDTVVLGPHLDGECDLIERVIFPLRLADKRVVLLPGSISDPVAVELSLRAVACGVYDVLFDPVDAERLVKKLESPGTLAAALKDLGVSAAVAEQIVAEAQKLVSPGSEAVSFEGSTGNQVQTTSQRRTRTHSGLREPITADTPVDAEGEKPEPKKTGTRQYRIPELDKATARATPPGGTRAALQPFPSGSRLVTVWNPTGYVKNFTALNVAAAAARVGYDVALVNYDFVCPELDLWFGVRQTGPSDCRPQDAGLATFGESLTAELALKILTEWDWGIKYLPAGSKLGYIGIPDFGENAGTLFREITEAVHRREARRPRLTVVNAGVNFEEPATFAALSICDVILLPLLGFKQEVEVTRQILEELRRVDVKAPVLEVIFTERPRLKSEWRIGGEQVALLLDSAGYREASRTGRPYCLMYKQKEPEWANVVRTLLQVPVKLLNPANSIGPS
ncbi:MAG: hypothetical protein ACPLQP_06085 [Moorellaceae bacterium]